MEELNKILNQDESVLWEGSPSFWPFFFGRSLPLTIFGIFWMGILTGRFCRWDFVGGILSCGNFDVEPII